MSTMEWMVIIGGLAAIIWINWYFFLARPVVSNAAIDLEGVQEVTIVVEGGYHPAVVRVKRDQACPARLRSTRTVRLFGRGRLCRFRDSQILARLREDQDRADAVTDRPFHIHLRDEHVTRSAHRARLTRRPRCRPRLPCC